MVAVKRYTVSLNKSGDTVFNIPITMPFKPSDNTDIVDRDFVSYEVDKSVNPIIDYGTVRFIPYHGSTKLTKIKYVLNFNNGTSYEDIGYSYDDINLRRNNFNHSSLQLEFYDSPSMTDQNYLYNSALYCRTLSSMFTNGKLKNIADIPVEFSLEDPVFNPTGISEGFYIYDYKSGSPKDIFVRYTFNNAKNGKSVIFMNTQSAKNINELQGSLFMRYSLVNSGNTFIYKVNDSDNVSKSGTEITINLYEANII